MQALTKTDLSKFYFGSFAVMDLGGVPCFVTRTGYTGEDGFEISIPNERTLEFTEKLMAGGSVHLSGSCAHVAAGARACFLDIASLLTLACPCAPRPWRTRQLAPGGGTVPVRQRPG
jgi:hypothetical protein